MTVKEGYTLIRFGGDTLGVQVKDEEVDEFLELIECNERAFRLGCAEALARGETSYKGCLIGDGCKAPFGTFTASK